MRAYYNQQSFNYGQFGKKIAARSEIRYYKKACKKTYNFRPTIQGPLEKRKGTVYVAETKDSTKNSRLVKFIFSEIDSFVLEFGDQYIRFYQGTSVVGVPYEISSPYLHTEIQDLKFAQIGDICYIAHPNYRPYKLSRIANTNWTLAPMDNKMGPVRDVNEGATTITLSGTLTVAGSSTWTASASIFTANMVGSVWAIADSANANIAYARMTTYTSGTVAVFTNQTDLTAVTTAATTKWYEGAWSGARGYPRAVAFHEQRLCFGGTAAKPLEVYCSVGNGAYENFDKGTATATDAMRFEINGALNAIQWLLSDGNFLVAGTFGGLAFIGSTGVDTAFTATNVKARSGTSFGSSGYQGVHTNNTPVYTHSNTKSLYKAQYEDTNLKYSALDLTDFSDDILSGSSTYIDTVEQPDQTVLVVSNGSLMCLSYDETQGDGTIPLLGWYQYDIGGTIESVASVPTLGDDRIWVIVNRAGGRYVEYFYIGDSDIYVDSAITYSGAATRTLTGLGHLEGENVSVWGDGSYAGDYTVASGSITIPSSKSAVELAYIGLPYNADFESMPLDPQSQQGMQQTQNMRVSEVQFILYKTKGIQVGESFENLLVEPIRNVTSQMNEPTALVGADYPEVVQSDFNGTWTRQATICLRSALPFPCTLVAYMAKMEVESS